MYILGAMTRRFIGVDAMHNRDTISLSLSADHLRWGLRNTEQFQSCSDDLGVDVLPLQMLVEKVLQIHANQTRPRLHVTGGNVRQLLQCSIL